MEMVMILSNTHILFQAETERERKKIISSNVIFLKFKSLVLLQVH